MKLYGLAVAALSPEEDKNIVKVISTPIAVSDGKRTEFEIIHDLAFRTQFNLASQQEVIGCFVKTVDLIGKLVELQKESLAENKRYYKPVSVQIGDDSRKPVDHKNIFSLLFGPRTEGDSLPSGCKQSYSADFKEACARLIPLMGQCVLEWGSYCPGKIYTPDLPPTPLDIRLAELKKDFDKGSAEAREDIMFLAYESGRSYGSNFNFRPVLFSCPNPPEGYADDIFLQQKFPRFAFYDWDPIFRKAFYTGFESVKEPGSCSRHIKLPMDPCNPPFTDPCADMVTAQFEILDLKRHYTQIEDKPEWREKIAVSAKAVLALG